MKTKIFNSGNHFLYAIISSLFLSLVFGFSSASATDYSMSITTSGDIDINAPAGTTAIDSSEINVITTCQAGYNLAIVTSVGDNNLYLGGDSSNNTDNTFITPADGTTSLINASNTWGYLLSPTLPTSDNIFFPVSSNPMSPSVLKTDNETASESDIDDSFSIYYGANIGATIASGIYTMISDNSLPEDANGGIVYYLTPSFSCAATLDISYNKNMDGSGSETPEDPEDIVSNFPTSSDNVVNPYIYIL